MKNIVITGAGAGLGKAIADKMETYIDVDGGCPFNVFRVDRKFGHDVRIPQGTDGAPACYSGPSIRAFPALERVDVLINCAGINRIAWFDELSNEIWNETLSINAMAIWKTTEHYLDQLRAEAHEGSDRIAAEAYISAKSGKDIDLRGRGGTVLNIVSNASHMPMRCSLAYNASKGAAHIMTLQMARELGGSHGLTVFGISPNKLAGTEMSADIDAQVMATRGWTAEKAREYQLAGLATGQETDPAALAEFIVFLLSTKDRHRFLHGCILPYGA